MLNWGGLEEFMFQRPELCYIKDHMMRSMARLLGTSLGRNFAEWVMFWHCLHL